MSDPSPSRDGVEETVIRRLGPSSLITAPLYVFTLGLWAFWRPRNFIILTSQRVIRHRGLISRHEKTIPIEMVQDVNVTVTPFGSRILVSTAGGGPSIMRMDRLRKRDARSMGDAIRQAAVAARGARIGAPVPVASATVEQRLGELDGLLERGVVTPAEYAEKRARILDGL